MWPIGAGWDHPDVPRPGILLAQQLANQAAEDKVTPIQQRDRLSNEAPVTANFTADSWMSAPVSSVQ